MQRFYVFEAPMCAEKFFVFLQNLSTAMLNLKLLEMAVREQSTIYLSDIAEVIFIVIAKKEEFFRHKNITKIRYL